MIECAYPSKQCQRCLAFKALSAFHRNATAPDGLNRWCKRCLLAQQRLRRAERAMGKILTQRQKLQAQTESGTKACRGCGQVKAVEEFKSDSRRKDGKVASCKVCTGPASRRAWARYREKQAQ